ncbi:hypothetical protein [Pinirhizobacter sp.]|jgi:hypothetical protein|uniref:hypothetical protein n=1 Tax=Pinirhizobacter sp. TaxID=2950432 RepID=UPI002F40DACD
MGIDDILLILILLGVTLAAVATYFLWPRSEDDASAETVPATITVPETAALGSAEAFRMHPAEDRSRGGDLVLLSADGRALLGLGPMAPLGEEATPLDDPAGIAQAHACQLAVDLIARSMSVPGATIELIYHPKIRNLLAEPGVELVKVRPGDGRRAMQGALDSRKFRGYGVAIEAGRLGQVGKELEQLGRVMAATHPEPATHVRLAIVFDAVERACRVHPL